MLHIINELGRETQKPGGAGADPAWVCGNKSAVSTEPRRLQATGP
eukprot:COSAG02_NODE_53413_length_302_cov_0.655172_1_plen_44_part_10